MPTEGLKLIADNSPNRYFFKGTPDEFFVSWPGQEQQVTNGLQDYIKKQVAVGDPISLWDAVMKHRSRPIGRLSRKVKNRLRNTGTNSRLRVSNVIRYSCGRYFQENSPDFWEQLHSEVKQQGWFYIVLAKEYWQQTKARSIHVIFNLRLTNTCKIWNDIDCVSLESYTIKYGINRWRIKI